MRLAIQATIVRLTRELTVVFELQEREVQVRGSSAVSTVLEAISRRMPTQSRLEHQIGVKELFPYRELHTILWIIYRGPIAAEIVKFQKSAGCIQVEPTWKSPVYEKTRDHVNK